MEIRKIQQILLVVFSIAILAYSIVIAQDLLFGIAIVLAFVLVHITARLLTVLQEISKSLELSNQRRA